MHVAMYRLPRDRGALSQRLQRRRVLFDRGILSSVGAIFDDVGLRGDAAVRSATLTHDKVDLTHIAVPEAYVDECVNALSEELRVAIEAARKNIRQVNELFMPEPEWRREIRPGTVIGEKATALHSVGLWVPATKGPLISTALMLACAAKVAGVRDIAMGMPPGKTGQGDPGTIAAARISGADRFVVGNGVAVVAGFSVGTESIPETDGIFGPGPGGIAAAMSIAYSYGKRTVMGVGPTDCAILADDTADPERIAYDLLNEAEHGADSSVMLVTLFGDFAMEVRDHIEHVVDTVAVSRREVLEAVFGPRGMGAIAVVEDFDQAAELVNDFGPEHLMIDCREAVLERVLPTIRNAGEILIGSHTPFSAANYAIGITAVLPTNGYARVVSGITCRDMLKYSTVGSLSREALVELLPTIRSLGTYEGLPFHVRAAEMRVRDRATRTAR